MSANNINDPRRPANVHRYQPPPSDAGPMEDPTPDYMSVLIVHVIHVIHKH